MKDERVLYYPYNIYAPKRRSEGLSMLYLSDLLYFLEEYFTEEKIGKFVEEYKEIVPAVVRENYDNRILAYALGLLYIMAWIYYKKKVPYDEILDFWYNKCEMLYDREYYLVKGEIEFPIFALRYLVDVEVVEGEDPKVYIALKSDVTLSDLKRRFIRILEQNFGFNIPEDIKLRVGGM